MPHHHVRGGTTARTSDGRFSHRPCHDALPVVSSTGARGGRDVRRMGGGLEPPQRWALRAVTHKVWGFAPETGWEQGSDRNPWATHHRVATAHRNTQWICQRGKRVDTGPRRTMKRRIRMAPPEGPAPARGFLHDGPRNGRSSASEARVSNPVRGSFPARHMPCVSVGRVRIPSCFDIDPESSATRHAPDHDVAAFPP